MNRTTMTRRLALLLTLVTALSILPTLPTALAVGGDARTEITAVTDWETPEDEYGTARAGAVWTTSAPVPAATLSTVGLQMPAGIGRTFQLRASHDGHWGPWTPLEVHLDEGPDSGTREWDAQQHVTQPVWVGGAQHVQVRAAGAEAPDDVYLHAVAFRGGVSVAARQPVQTAHAATAAAPQIVTRSEWDPQNRCSPRSSASLADNARFAVIHHTASANSYADQDAAAAAVLGICLYHRNSRGWNDIGYNFLVDRFGNIYEGRNGGMHNAPVGAHASGYNSGAIGVAVLGCHTHDDESGCDSNDPASNADRNRAMAAVDDLLAWKFSLHGIDPHGTTVEDTADGPRTLATINGHRDLGTTTCPGGHIHDRVVDDAPDPMAPRIVDNTRLMSGTWQAWTFADRDGDQRDDLLAVDGRSHIWNATSTGTHFHPTADTRYITETGWDTHLIGDFDGDGTADVASYHPSNGTWWVSTGARRNQRARLWQTFETPGGWDTHRVGDFNGDGRDDIASFHPSNGTWWVSLSAGTSFTVSRWAQWPTTAGWTHEVTGDVNGDGRDDLVTFHEPSGRWWASVSTGTGFRSKLWATWSSRTGWDHVAAGDVDADGRTDLLAYHSRTGRWWVARSTGSSFATYLRHEYSSPQGWTAHTVADVDGDGISDVASYNVRNRTIWAGSTHGRYGTSGMRRVAQLSVGAHVTELAAATLEGDGPPSLVAGGPAGGWWSLRGAPSGADYVRVGP